MHEQFGTNEVHQWSLSGGDLDAGFAEADVVVERRVVNHRTAGAPIEPRGVLADYRAGSLTLWSATQVPHFVRLFLALLLGISEERVRVIAPEVGGGFGAKLQVYGEEVLAAWVSRKTGRPVKWIETRSENMAVTHQGRDQIAYTKMGAKRDGTITAWHVRIIADFGAYNMLLTPLIPSLGAFVMGGCTRSPRSRPTSSGCSRTNARPMRFVAPVARRRRTWSRYASTKSPRSSAWIRSRSAARTSSPRSVPGGGGNRRVYDSGDYEKTLDKLLEHVDVGAFRREQEELRAEGRLPRHRLLDLHRDLRAGPVADHRAQTASACKPAAGSRRWFECTTPAR